jgi:hypothetical protein
MISHEPTGADGFCRGVTPHGVGRPPPRWEQFISILLIDWAGNAVPGTRIARRRADFSSIGRDFLDMLQSAPALR